MDHLSIYPVYLSTQFTFEPIIFSIYFYTKFIFLPTLHFEPIHPSTFLLSSYFLPSPPIKTIIHSIYSVLSILPINDIKNNNENDDDDDNNDKKDKNNNNNKGLDRDLDFSREYQGH